MRANIICCSKTKSPWNGGKNIIYRCAVCEWMHKHIKARMKCERQWPKKICGENTCCEQIKQYRTCWNCWKMFAYKSNPIDSRDKKKWRNNRSVLKINLMQLCIATEKIDAQIRKSKKKKEWRKE